MTGPPGGDSGVGGDERVLAIYEALRAHELELNRATAAFEHAVIAPLTLVNGGAAAAWLALLGDRDSVGWLWVPATTWAVGLVLAVLAAALGWRRQKAFAMAERLRREAWELLWLSPAATPDELASVVTNTAFRRAWAAEIAAVEAIGRLGSRDARERKAQEVTEAAWQEARLLAAVSIGNARRFSLLFQIAIWASVAAFVVGGVLAAAIL